MRQRVVIAMALASNPSLLLADEPTTALDVTVQARVLHLLRDLQQQLGMSVIFVTHDLAVAAEIADDVAVMYAGRIVETGTLREVVATPRHPYTRGLLASTIHGAKRGVRLEAIPGAPPRLDRLPAGCAFAPRCREVVAACTEQEIATVALAPGREVRCIRALESAGIAQPLQASSA
jgi:peptide/nickel transport system ATP-binding protein